MKCLFTLSVLLLLFLQSCHSQDNGNKSSPTRLRISKERSDSLALHVPKAIGYTSDFVHLFADNEIQTLDSLVSAYEKITTVQFAIATVDSNMVKGKDFEDYTLVMLRTWGVGRKETNNGILIVISPDLRRMRIQNGYGIEKFLSDAETKKIIDTVFIPRFKEAKYFEGTREGVIAITKKLKQNGLKY